MTIKIWGVTSDDTVYTMFYENVTKYEIKPQWKWYYLGLEKVVEGFDLIIYQGKEKIVENLSINTTFSYDNKEKQLYVEFHDY